MTPRLSKSLAPVALLAAGALASCRGDGSARAASAGSQAPTVQVVAAAAGVLPRVVTVTGTLAAEEDAALGMKVAGRVSEILADLGSRASKGQPLARLIPTDAELRQQQAEASLQQARARLGLSPGDDEAALDPATMSLVRQAQAVLEEARLRRERAKTLVEDQLISQSDLDAAEAAFQVADGRYQDAREEILNRLAILAQRKVELDQARQQLTDTTLYAPFEGAVRERHVAVGQYVAIGQPIVTLVRTHPLRLKLAVPERDAAALRAGQRVSVRIEGDPQEHEGRLARLSAAIEEGSRTLMVEAEVPNTDGALRPGAFAKATIVTSAGEPAVLVPLSAIVTFAGMEKVLTVEEGRSVERRVRTGRRQQGTVEILEGIAAGDQVIVEPGSLVGGQPVTVTGS